MGFGETVGRGLSSGGNPFAFGGGGGGGGKNPLQQLFSFFNTLLSSPLGGFLAEQGAAAGDQRRADVARTQQEGLFGVTQGITGIGDLPGIPSVTPPSGLDLSTLAPQAGELADRLGNQSSNFLRLMQESLGRNLGTMSPLQRDLRGLPGQFATENQNILDRFGQRAGDIQSEFGTGAAGITRGFADRLSTGLGILEGRGAQAEEDISTRFAESLGNQLGDLRSRGFGGTLGANIAQGSVREESAEQRRLQEQLRGERLGVFTSLSGEGLAARERLLGAGTGLATGFAGTELGAAQAGQGFLGNLNLNVLQQRGGLGQFIQQMLAGGRQQELMNQFQLGQFPIGVQQQAIGQTLGALGPFQIEPPRPTNFSVF